MAVASYDDVDVAAVACQIHVGLLPFLLCVVAYVRYGNHQVAVLFVAQISGCAVGRLDDVVELDACNVFCGYEACRVNVKPEKANLAPGNGLDDIRSEDPFEGRV